MRAYVERVLESVQRATQQRNNKNDDYTRARASVVRAKRGTNFFVTVAGAETSARGLRRAIAPTTIRARRRRKVDVFQSVRRRRRARSRRRPTSLPYFLRSVRVCLPYRRL